MKKFQLDLTVADNRMVSPNSALLTLQSDEGLPDMVAGQFAELKVPSAKVLLRRPLSIHSVDRSQNRIEFLIQAVGEGTAALAAMRRGEILNVLLPLATVSVTAPYPWKGRCL